MLLLFTFFFCALQYRCGFSLSLATPVSRMCFFTVIVLQLNFSIKDIATTTRLKLRDEEVSEKYVHKL